MKLVRELYGDERQLIVSENIIEHGFYFGDNQCDLLSNAPEEVFEDYLKEREDYDILFFHDFLRSQGHEYYLLERDTNICKDAIVTSLNEYKFLFNSNDESYYEHNGDIGYDEIVYLDWYDGHNFRQIDIDDEIIDLEKLDTRIEGYEQHATHQYDLYKSEDGTLYLHDNSYYQGQLGSVEEISEEELKERFDYELD